MNFKSWLLLSEWARSPEYLETNSLQALSENLPESDLKTRYKRLVSEWDKKNNILTAKDVTPGSDKIINWKCEKGHIWPAPLSNRTSGRNCPTCANKRIGDDNSLQALSENLPESDLKTRYKRLVSEWDKKNNILTAKDVTPGSDKIINWKCEKGHIWPAPLSNRTSGRNCPTCANKRIGDDNSLQALSENLPESDLKTRYKRLVSEWDKKNNTLTPSDVTPGSKKMINWKCLEKGHKWAATLNNRTNGNNCHDCAIAKASLNNQIKNDQNLKKLGIYFNDKKNPDKEEPLPNDPLSDFLYLKRKAYQDFKNKTNYTSSKWYKTDKKVGEEAGLPKDWYLPVDKKGISKPAKLVEKILNKYFGDVVSEYIDRECNAITGQCLRFDYSFIYKDQEYFVEYHGEQHYYPRYFGSTEGMTDQVVAKLALDAFKVNQKNDRKKYNYCESKGFPLLVIPYWNNANKFEDIILSFIKHDDEFDTFFADPVVPQKNKEYHDKMYAEYLANSKPTEVVEPKTTASVTQEPTKTFEQFLINKNFINI